MAGIWSRVAWLSLRSSEKKIKTRCVRKKITAKVALKWLKFCQKLLWQIDKPWQESPLRRANLCNSMSDEEANLPSAKECQKRVEQVCNVLYYVLYLSYVLFMVLCVTAFWCWFVMFFDLNSLWSWLRLTRWWPSSTFKIGIGASRGQSRLSSMKRPMQPT